MNIDLTFSNTALINKDENQLEILVAKYPWCSAARLSLLQSYQRNSSPQFEEQAKKTALFFNNITWLHRQVYSYVKDEIETEGAEDHHSVVTETIIDEVRQPDTEATSTDEEMGDKLPVAAEITQHKISESVDTPKPTVEIQEPLVFEPLHTTDYFASQGIKLTDEPISKDKLGTQLKSFTEWLKSMKKIHSEKLPAGDEASDRKIQQIAEHSNADAEVVTEAMAEVFASQHKTVKAIEVYRKLSLINPSKSAYFAAKIASLSGSKD